MFLMCPPEGVLLEHLILLEVLSHSPALVIRKCQTILLEQGVDARYTTIPRVFQVVQRQSTVLGRCFFSLKGIFGPNALGVNEFTFPRLDVAVQVGDELVLLVRHACSEVRNTRVCLL